MPKKTKEETTKKESQKKNDFDIKSAIEKLEVPIILKNGFYFYLINNNIQVQSENDLNTKLTNFKKMNAGA